MTDGVQKVVMCDPAALRETPENFHVYRRPTDNDPAWLELRASIAVNGVQAPIEISTDRYVISGHRRRLAAQLEGKQVPCIVTPVNMAALTEAERIKLLVSRNQGIRVKSDAEAYLEAAAAVDPEEAVREARRRRAEVFDKPKTCLTEVQIRGGISRTDPSGERAEFLRVVLAILAAKRAANFLPTSARHIHYALLSKGVRTSTRRNSQVYGVVAAGLSDSAKAKARKSQGALLSKLLTDARSAGLIDASDLDDATRPTSEWMHNGCMGQYVDRELTGLFKNYFSPIHQEQPMHLELLVEKNTVFPLLRKHVAAKYRLPITSLRGYGSFPAARDVAARYAKSGKEKLVVIYVSDLDPEGLDMPASWKKYLKHDFGVEASVYRAAVTSDQVERHDLPPDTDVKLSSTRAKRYIAEYGEKCWELDGMPEALLINEVSRAVESILDMDALTGAMEREREADIKLARMNAAVRRFVNKQFKHLLEA